MRSSNRPISGVIASAALAFVIAAGAAFSAAAEQWIRSGPGPDVYVRGVRLFANTPTAGQSVLFASTLGAGVVKVVDNGSSITTTQINNGLPAPRIRTIAATDVNTLVAAVEHWGVYKSVDGGANWTAANGSGGSALGCRVVRNVAMRSTTEYLAFGACRRDSGIYRTLDGGGTWQRLGVGTIPDDASVGSLTFSGSGATTVVIASTGRDGIFRSNDNGGTWAQINNGLPAPAGANRISVFVVSVLANATQLLAYVEGHGVYRTTDGGANWAAFGTGIPANTHSVSGISRESATLLYLGSDKGPVYRTTNGGLNWSAWANSGTAAEHSYVRGVTIDATAVGRYWLHGINGLVRTNDSGATFTSINMPEGYVASANLAANGATAYVVAQDVYKVADIYNPDWTSAVSIGGTLPGAAASVFVDTANAGTLYVTVPNRGVYKSVNDGASWTQLPVPNLETGVNPVLEGSLSDAQTRYIGLDNKFGVVGRGGFLKSINGGATWADSSTGLNTPDARQVNSIGVSTNPSLLVIATDEGLFRSTNAGGSWTSVLSVLDEALLPLPFSSVRFDPVNPDLVWAAALQVDPNGTVRTSSGVYKSFNGGATWTQVLSGKRATTVRPESSGRVAVLLNRDLSQPAILATTDGGASWQPFNNGIAVNDGEGLTRIAGGAHLAFAFTGSGTYVLEKPQLSVSINGSGAVTSSPTGVACLAACTARFYDNELVNLTAAPASGRYFGGWSGNCSGTGTCQLVMDAARAVTATFVATMATDLNRDGRSDLLWRNTSTGQVYRLSMDGFAVAGAALVYHEPNTAWTIVADADFNGDGVADLLWRNSSNGQVYAMPFNTSGAPAGGAVVHVEPNAAWKIIHTPDLNGDGKADLLWWNSSTGQVYAMLMNGFSVTIQNFVYTEPNTAWKIVAVGDFAGSGKQNQLLYRNSTTGQVFLMTVSVSGGGFTQTGQMIYQEPNTAWKIIAAADFSGDGKSDLLWRNDSTGQVYMMLMNGGAVANQNMIHHEPNLAWKIVAQGDYNGDGKADLLWRNESTGQIYMMLMNGLFISNQAMVYQEGNLDWKVLGTREYTLATGVIAP